VLIVLEVKPGTPAATVAGARAIIETIEYEPSDATHALRLYLTIPAGWDSG
jgi:hypothetical protein